jgi:hypothetical protein
MEVRNRSGTKENMVLTAEEVRSDVSTVTET